MNRIGSQKLLLETKKNQMLQFSKLECLVSLGPIADMSNVGSGKSILPPAN
jgi:hypothetical protein